MFVEQINASEKLCPMTLGRGGVAELCRGKRCMAWRWVSAGRDESARGYCGLAGVPEYEPPEK